MKIIVAAGITLLLANAAYAQQKEGRVVYERTTQMQIRLDNMADNTPQMLPSVRTNKLEVLFANNQSLRKAINDERPESDIQEGGMQIRMIVAGADDISYANFNNGSVTEQREFAGKKYIVADSVRKLNWKLTGESKTILNYPCQKAVTQRISERRIMSMENGQMNSKTMPDTANIAVWFTGSIPVSAGPDFQGQLPGLILEIDINNGHTMYKALEVSPKVDVSQIKEPKSGKKITVEEFDKERDKTMQEMQKNMGGRGRSFRINS